jgi:hypothetical protein
MQEAGTRTCAPSSSRKVTPPRRWQSLASVWLAATTMASFPSGVLQLLLPC